jgi:sigma-B regulation protein RsbU (phosphoserine phosphatase)
MNAPRSSRGLSARDIEPILAVTRNLAAPFDLITMLTEVVSAAKQVLKAEAGSVWLYDADSDELVLRVATDLEPVRVPARTGIVGSCATQRSVINVPDCYADPRFNPEMDKLSGFRTRCMLALPLVDHKEVLVGVLQVLNKAGGIFDQDDEVLATALAAQCAVALQRVRMTEALIDGEKMRQQLEMARVVQMSTLPSAMPAVPGYDVFGMFRPADLTGGDTFDLAALEQGLLVVLGDATGHGIAPALHVTQMHAMLRMAFRMGADLESAFIQVNNQLAESLPADRFITAFIGLLDTSSHQMRFHSGGQAPILHFQAAAGSCVRYNPTSFPLAAMPLTKLRPAVALTMEPGDILVLLTDGIYEYQNASNEEFGEQRVAALFAAHRDRPAHELSALLLDAVRVFADGAIQEDDITVVLVKRDRPTVTDQRAFRRSADALQDIFQFTSAFFRREQVDEALLHAVDFTVEELFTNMVKYSKMSDAAVDLRLTRIDGGVEATLTDHDVEPFDITQWPDANVNLPIEQREAGGLGIHLIRRLVDSIDYEYAKEGRQSRITFRKTLAGRPAGDGIPNEKGE